VQKVKQLFLSFIHDVFEYSIKFGKTNTRKLIFGGLVADKSSYQVKSEVDTTEYDSSETQHKEPEDLTDITNVVTEEVLSLPHHNP